jgi:hypothetical protein
MAMMNYNRIRPERNTRWPKLQGAARPTERKGPDMAQCIASLDWLSSSISL